MNPSHFPSKAIQTRGRQDIPAAVGRRSLNTCPESTAHHLRSPENTVFWKHTSWRAEFSDLFKVPAVTALSLPRTPTQLSFPHRLPQQLLGFYGSCLSRRNRTTLVKLEKPHGWRTQEAPILLCTWSFTALTEQCSSYLRATVLEPLPPYIYLEQMLRFIHVRSCSIHTPGDRQCLKAGSHGNRRHDLRSPFPPPVPRHGSCFSLSWGPNMPYDTHSSLFLPLPLLTNNSPPSPQSHPAHLDGTAGIRTCVGLICYEGWI